MEGIYVQNWKFAADLSARMIAFQRQIHLDDLCHISQRLMHLRSILLLHYNLHFDWINAGMWISFTLNLLIYLLPDCPPRLIRESFLLQMHELVWISDKWSTPSKPMVIMWFPCGLMSKPSIRSLHYYIFIAFNQDLKFLTFTFRMPLCSSQQRYVRWTVWIQMKQMISKFIS